LVEIFDAHYKLTTSAARKEPGEQGCAQIAHV
jgi:hypothetical protein